MTKTRRGLGMRAWVTVFTVMSVGFVAFVYVVTQGLLSDTQDYIRMDAPGRLEIELKHAGKYLIFHEYQRTSDSQGLLRPAGVEDMSFLVLRGDDSSPIQVVDTGWTRPYTIRRTVGEPIREFVAPSAGLYEFSATSPVSGDVPPVTLAIGRPYNDRIVGAFLAGMIPLAITFAIIAVTLFVAHQRAQRIEPVMESAP